MSKDNRHRYTGNEGIMSKKPLCLFVHARAVSLAILVLSSGFAVQAAPGNAGEEYDMESKITGTIVATGSCTFNQGEAVTVDFKTVRLKPTGSNTVELDGDYTQLLNAALSCSGDTAGLLQMKFTSTSGSYETYNGTQVLGSDKGIVGIQLLVDGTAQDMGKWFTIDPNNQPVLQAKLVQVSTANTSNVANGDAFTAPGTLTVAFN